jgi:mono/diheme cytochrome c family protein
MTRRMQALGAAVTVALGAAALVATPAAARVKVVAIQLPPQGTAFRPAPGVEIAQRECLTCHSAEYVTQQPALSKAAWTAEVVKMRAAYGAPIPASESDDLVAYLVAQNPVAAK